MIAAFEGFWRAKAEVLTGELFRDRPMLTVTFEGVDKEAEGKGVSREEEEGGGV